MPDEFEHISQDEIDNRCYWVGEIENLSGNFGNDFERLQQELSDEVASQGMTSLLAHVRLCGAIPEQYPHDSSAEKLYSKYTDALLAEAFNFIGIKSLVLTERADVADVECVVEDFSFVADAKAFRLSRTAKNQKDFKVQAMDNWKHGKKYAVVVCPSYQLPSRTSQIYLQAITRNVCVFSYSHLAVLVKIAEQHGQRVATKAMQNVFEVISTLHPTKDSQSYWRGVNSALIASHEGIAPVWREEKLAMVDSIRIAKTEALTQLATERERIMRLSHNDALKELVRKSNIENRENVIRAVSDSGILSMV